MTRRIWAAIRLDTLFQFRSGLHAIYVVLSFIYIVAINVMPKSWGDVAVPFMIFSDPAVLGFFFIGGLVMLEKGQGIIDLIEVTPASVGEYLLGKVIALNVISLLASLAIAVFTDRDFNLLVLLVAVMLTASFFTMFGFYIALGSRSMNHYFGRVIPMMVLIIVPCFSLIGFPYSELFYVVPSVAAAKLIFGAFWQVSLLEMIVCTVSLLIWNYGVYRAVIAFFDKRRCNR